MELGDVFSQKIIQRGYNYYKDGRVKYVIKDGDLLYGTVVGNFDYYVRVDLGEEETTCNCPYDGDCKHAVALILAYKNQEYLNGSKIKELLEDMDKSALIDIISKTVLKDPKLAEKLLAKEKIQKKTDNKVGSEVYDLLLKDINTHPFPEEFLSAVSTVSCGDKAMILDFLSKVIKEQDDIVGCFPDSEDYYYGGYDDYSSYDDLCEAMGEVIDGFFAQKPNEKELKEFSRLYDENEYGRLMDCTESVLEHYQNVPEEYAKTLLDNRDYVKYLMKHNRTDDALNACKDTVQKFKILQEMDEEKALEFALKNLLPDHANKVAEYMLTLKKDNKDILDILLQCINPSYDLLCKLEDAVLEKKYLVYDTLFKKKRYETYYLLCKRFEDDAVLCKLTVVQLDDDLAFSVGKHLIKTYPEEAVKILEKSLFRVIKEAYGGYMKDAKEILEIISGADSQYAETIYGRIAKAYPTRTQLKHHLKKVL